MFRYFVFRVEAGQSIIVIYHAHQFWHNYLVANTACAQIYFNRLSTNPDGVCKSTIFLE